MSSAKSVTVISLYRILQLRGLSLYSYDPTWTGVKPTIWSVFEISLAMLGACAITYRPLFRWIFRNWILKIQPFFSRPAGKIPRRRFIKSSIGNAGIGVRSNEPTVTEMHSLSAFHPSVPLSIYSPPRRFGKENAFCRIDESRDI